MKLKFIVAEEFRQEANNKVSAIGVFSGDTVILLKSAHPTGTPSDVPIGIERLAFLITVSELAGVHNYDGEIVGPNGRKSVLGKQSVGREILIEPGMSHSIIIESKPFIVSEAGIYKFILYIDDSPHEFPFEIRFQE